ncbi:MAG: hypothetical protein K2M55_05630 [Muribaculaceae bacterium]|nr:hypothetical protein [Muribaculaceae bacterium]
MKKFDLRWTVLLACAVICLQAVCAVPEMLAGYQDMDFGQGKFGYIKLPEVKLDDNDLVDPFLAESVPFATITLADSGITGNLLYQRTIFEGKPAQKYGWQGYIYVTTTYNGKEIEYQSYDNPDIYYGIIDFPEGRFYGFYTTGYKGGHPFNYTRLLYGTLVDKDGNRVDVNGVLPSQYSNKKFNPVGTYYLNRIFGAYDAKITLKAGGAGQINLTKLSHHTAHPRLVGTSTERYASGKVKKQHRLLSGGYDFYLHTNITVPIKWTMDDSQIEITYSAKPTINVKGEVDAATEFKNTEISASDRQIEKQRHRADLPTNEDFKEQKKIVVDDANESFKPGETRYIPVDWHNSEMAMVKYVIPDKMPLYIPMTYKNWDLSNEKYYDLIGLSEGLTSKYVKNRENGASNYYPILIQRMKNAIKYTDIPLLKQCQEFAISDVNMADMTGTIVFFNDAHMYESVLSLDDDDKIDVTLFNEKLSDDNIFSQTIAQVKETDEYINSYAKDKRRSKIVKEYNKAVKGYRYSFETPAANFGDLYRVYYGLGKTLELQKQYKGMLE